MRNYFIINGKSSLEIQGLAVNQLPPISKPAKRVLTETIDGKDGDIQTELGYSAYDKSATIGLYGTYDIDEIISFFDTEGTIIFSDEPDKFYRFKIVNQIDFNALIKLRTAKVVFHCQPFKYDPNEEPIEHETEIITGTGSEITLNDTVEGNVLTIVPKGNLTQETTSGSQLFNAYAIHYSDTIVPSENGSKITLPIDVSGNGNAPTGSTLATLCPNLKVDDTVYLYFTRNLGTTYNNFIYLHGVNTVWSNGTQITITQAILDSEVVLYGNRYISGETGQCILTDFRIVKTENAPFEPFTNGAAPNPDFPMPIHVVTGDNTVKIQNKNWFNINDITNSAIYNMTMDTSNNVLTLTSTGTGGAQYCTKYIDGLDSSKTYNLSFKAKKVVKGTDGNPYISFLVSGTNDNTNYTFVRAYSNTNPTQGTEYEFSGTITGYKKYRCYIYNNSNTPVTVGEQTQYYEIQLEEGTSASPYEEYKVQTQELSLGAKNLISLGTQLNGYADGGVQKFIVEPAYCGYYFETSKLPNEISIYSEDGNRVTVSYYNSIPYNNLSYQSMSYFVGNQRTITVDKTSAYMHILFSTQYANVSNIKITGGDHIQYISDNPIELCKISTYQDYITGSPDNWKVHKEIGKVVLDGSEGWGLNATGTNTYRFRVEQTNLDSAKLGFCSNNQWIVTGFSNDNQLVGILDSYIYYRINKSIIDSIQSGNTTTDKFKIWMSTNNAICYTSLITPTETDITDTTLISQLNELYEMYSYNGQTNISAIPTGDNALMILDVSVFGDSSVTVTNEGNIYSKPNFTLYGSGTIGIYLNGIQIFTVNLGDEEYITFDIENMEASKDGILKNRLVTGNYSNFKLQTGENTISFSGVVTGFEIENYSRWI